MTATETAPSIIEIAHRYRLLGKLGSGGMGAVYRAKDRLTGQDVALKMVSAPTQQLMFASRTAENSTEDAALRAALAREFQSLASLRHPQIISVLDYGFDAQRKPFYTMELLKDAQTIKDAAHAQVLVVQISLIVQMLQALAYLHRRGVIHRDLKPANVLVTNGQVKVLDFGVAAQDELTGGLVGTFAYMSPEVMQGMAATRASDLYAVGTMVYEIFFERHPFLTDSLMALMEAVLSHDPDFSASSHLPAPLVAILQRLLAKEPEDRYQDALEVIRDINAATKQSFVIETRATRESFLQAAKLVGRKTELDHFRQMIDLAVSGAGSVHLLTGESGVGKSRLLDELRTMALVKGALVLTGHALSNGGSPYQPWRDVVRRLVLGTKLDGEEAAVLKGIVPDIDTLLEQSIPDAPPLEPDAAQERLYAMVAEVLRRQREPIVVLLDDMQWAGPESMGLLAWLGRQVVWNMYDTSPTQWKVLIVAAAGDDVGSRTYPVDLQPLKLKRFVRQEIADLSVAMLGPAGKLPELIDLLERETEGNAFILVEVMRALAENAGQLEQISQTNLPEHVLASGVDQLVQRRLERVPPRAQPLLRIAAAAGRRLDLDVLDTIVEEQKLNLDLAAWLDECADATALEVYEGYWRFAHEKVRAALLNNISEFEHKDIHRRIAIAIEKVHQSKPDQVAALTYHWANAGNLERELHYTTLAAQQAYQAALYGDAQRLFTRALSLERDLSARRTVTEGQDPYPMRQIVLERQLADAYFGTLDFEKTREHMEHALTLLGFVVPRRKQGIDLALARETAVQTLHRTLPGVFVGRSQKADPRLTEASQIFIKLAQVYLLLQESQLTGLAVFWGLNISETANLPRERAILCSSVCVALGTLGQHQWAEWYAETARQLAQKAGDKPTIANVLQAVGLFGVSMGQWTQAKDSLTRTLEIAKSVGDRLMTGNTLMNMGLLSYMRGDFEHYYGPFEESLAVDRKTTNYERQMWALAAMAVARARQGQSAEVDDLLKSADELMRNKTINRLGKTVYHMAYLWKELCGGDLARAYQEAHAVVALLRETPRPLYISIEGFYGAGWAYRRVWEAGQADAAEAASLARAWCKDIFHFARAYPIAQPHAWLHQGGVEWLDGSQEAARQSWQKALTAAQKLKMPLQQGMVHYEIARHTDRSDPARQEHLDKAIALFTQCGAAYDLEQAKLALSVAPHNGKDTIEMDISASG